MHHLNTIILFIFLVITMTQAGPSLPKNCYLMELSSLGIPAAGNEHAAVRINDLQIFNGKIYIGYGDAVINTGPTDIIVFDLSTGEFKKEFTVDEEGIYTYKIVDSTLMIPGIDATEDWHFGNMYRLENETWEKYRSIPNGIHVHDIISYKDVLYVSTGTFGTIGDEVEHYFGALFSSTDKGETWSLAYATPSDDRSIFRVSSLLMYNDVLYAFPFAYTDMTKGTVPEQYREGLSEKPYTQDKYLIILDDILGTNDVVTFNGDRWQYEDILPIEHFCYTNKPFVFDDRLILPTLSGEYIDYLHKEKHLIPQAVQKLFAFDGNRIQELKLDCDRILDVVTKSHHAYVLIQKNSLFYIAQSADLKKWDFYVLPPIIDDARSFEYIDNTFFIGTENGNLFVSQTIEPTRKYEDIEQCVPDKLSAEAELPRDGFYYWIAISDWGKLTDVGRVDAEVKYGNIIKITTDNVNRFRIFLPHYYLDPGHETTVIINDQVVYEGITADDEHLMCTRLQHDSLSSWDIIPGKETLTQYVCEKKVLGTSRIPLTLDEVYPPVCTWKASALQWATKTAGAIIPQTSIRQAICHDTFYLEDLYDAHYRDQLCTFKATGTALEDMLEYNINLTDDRHCSIGGFSITFKTGENNFIITDCSLIPDQSYTITTTEYLAQRSEQYLGKKVEYELLEHDVYDAIVAWFDDFHTIEAIEPLIINSSP